MRSPSGCSPRTSSGAPSVSPGGSSRGPWARAGGCFCRPVRGRPGNGLVSDRGRIGHLLRSSAARRIAFLLTLVASATALSAPAASPARAVTLAPVDGGSNYYARFSHALPTSAAYFPIGVWFESVVSRADVDKDRAAGLNTYVVLTDNSDLGLVRSSGMHALVQGDQFSPHPGINGWFLADEVDMTHGPGAGYDEMRRIADATAHDGRIRYSNYGKGVLFWESDGEAARFVNAYQDIVSADAYFFTDDNICSGTEGGSILAGGADLSPAQCHRAANYGASVSRVRSLVNPHGSKPVWAIVELGHPFSEADWPTITPAEVRAAVYQSLIAGARGIVYFNHTFGGPNQTQHILRDGINPGSPYASIRSMVTATDAQIAHLAPVLNSPTVISGTSHNPGTTAMVKWPEGGKAKKGCKSKRGKKQRRKCKKGKRRAAASKKHKKGCKSKKKCRRARPNGDLYVFAGSAGSSVDGRFSLPCVGNTQAAVLGENRSVPVQHGSFSDHFADGNAIHIYRVDPNRSCKVRQRAAAAPATLPTAGGRGTDAAQPAEVHRGKPSHDVPGAVIAAFAVLVVGALALFGLSRLPGQAPGRSGRPNKHHRFGTR